MGQRREPILELDLEAAIERWCDQKRVAEIRRLEAIGYSRMTLAAIIGKETPEDRQACPLCRELDRLREELHAKLLRGELVAAGFLEGTPPNQLRTDVQPERWNVLLLDFDRSEVRGSGIRLYDIRVRKAEPATRVGPAVAMPPGQGLGLTPAIGSKLVISKGRSTVRFGRHGGVLPHRPFQLLGLLAEHLQSGKPIVSVDAIYRNMFASGASNRTIYSLVADLRFRLRRMSITAIDGKELICTINRQGFTLTITAEQLWIEPT